MRDTQFKLNENGTLDRYELDMDIIISLNPKILEQYQEEFFYDERNEIEVENTNFWGDESTYMDKKFNSPCEVEVDIETIVDLYEDYLDDIEEELKLDKYYDVLEEVENGIPFKCHFTKKDKSERELIGIFETYHKTKKDLIIVYDLVNDGYRSVNIETIKDITINKTFHDLTNLIYK